MTALRRTVLGVDPGLANVGWALVEQSSWNGGSSPARVLERGTVRTARQKGVGDVQRRLTEVGEELAPLIERAQFVVCEWPSAGGFRTATGRSSSTAPAQVNLVAGLIAGLARGIGRRLLTPAPVTWRKAMGAKQGKDEAIHARLLKQYAAELAGLRKGDLPHVLDALGLALYGLGAT